MNSYFSQILSNNLSALVSACAEKPWHHMDPVPPLQRWFNADDVTTVLAPWNHDFLLAVLGWIRTRYPQADDLIKTLGKLRVNLCNEWPSKSAFPYQVAMEWAGGSILDKGWERARYETFANQAGKDWSWHALGENAHAALASCVDAGLDGAKEALAKCDATIGNVSAQWDVVAR